MKAIHYTRYGGPEVLQLVEVERPTPAVHQVLIQVAAAGVNPLDDHFMRAEPWMVRASSGWTRPKNPRLGADVSGIVVEVGEEITKFKVGDRVFGDVGPSGLGSFAEYAVGTELELTHLPEDVPFDIAAAAPVAALTAVQGLRDYAKLVPGERVLINGASGGVGHCAVQYAKAQGAEVTAVCSGRNADFARSLGADHVIDYTREDFARTGAQYDLILDMVANRKVSDLRRALTPAGRCIVGGFSSLGYLFGLLLQAPLGNRKGQKVIMMPSAKVVVDDLNLVAEMMQQQTLVPSIEARFSLEQTPEAMAHLATARTRGKLIIEVAPQ